MDMLVYHGTDERAAGNIIMDGFVSKYNDEHWLGNGTYFFTDFSLAKWWVTRPSEKFGTKINVPVVLQCSIHVDDDRVLDLLKLDDYIQFSNIFEKEFYPQYVEWETEKTPIWKKLRCAFCDYIKKVYEIDAIIGNFYKQNQPYLPGKHGNVFDDFLLQYTEVQVCVFNREIIGDKDMKMLVMKG